MNRHSYHPHDTDEEVGEPRIIPISSKNTELRSWNPGSQSPEPAFLTAIPKHSFSCYFAPRWASLFFPSLQYLSSSQEQWDRSSPLGQSRFRNVLRYLTYTPLKIEFSPTLAGGDLLCPLSLRCALKLSRSTQFKAFLTADGTGGLVGKLSSGGMGAVHWTTSGLRDSITFHSWKTWVSTLEVCFYRAATGFPR